MRGHRRITNTDMLKWCLKMSLCYVYEVSMKRNLNFVFWLGSLAPITYLTMWIQVFPSPKSKPNPKPQWSWALWLRDAQPVSCLLPRGSQCILEPTHHLAETFLITEPQEFHVGFHMDRMGVGQTDWSNAVFLAKACVSFCVCYHYGKTQKIINCFKGLISFHSFPGKI